MLLINLNRYRAFFIYITGGPKPPPSPHGAPPPLNHFALPPVKVLFLQLNISKTWNLEGRFDILVTEICFMNLMSCLLSLFFNAKHCVVNTLLDFNHFPVDFIS